MEREGKGRRDRELTAPVMIRIHDKHQAILHLRTKPHSNPRVRRRHEQNGDVIARVLRHIH
jgi:hypothetical protein